MPCQIISLPPTPQIKDDLEKSWASITGRCRHLSQVPATIPLHQRSAHHLRARKKQIPSTWQSENLSLTIKKLFMNNVITMTHARSLAFLTLACAVCGLPLIAAGQDAAPLPAAPASPAPGDLRQADETFLQYEGASVKSAYEKKKAAMTRLAAALRKYAGAHDNYLPNKVDDLRETDPELFQQFDSKELKVPARRAFLLDTNPATAKLFMVGDPDVNGFKTLFWTDAHFRILFLRSNDPAVAKQQAAERTAVRQARVTAMGAQIDKEFEQEEHDMMADIKARQVADKAREDALLKGKPSEFRAAYTRKKMDLKQFAVETRMYCMDHGDKYPEDLGVVVTNSHAPKFYESFDVKRFEFVGPSRDEGELFRRGPEKAVTIREKDFDAHGMRGLIYADGHVEIELKTKEP